ncbi:MAG: CDP-alcohol phosphatidyltransferase family protein [Aestuariivirgaceae bacterium]|nr:CDP-alcohol phosphatidyltransferase family protein [Aestuariivirgaceae bacterium]
MFDAQLYPLTRRLADRAAISIARAGVTAMGMSLAGFVLGLAALPAIATGHYGTGLALILLNRMADGLDGALARREGPTDRGAFIDISLDFFFYGTVPLAFALANPEANALPACLLLLGFIGTGSSFLAFASLAAKRGLAAQNFPKKGIYYLGGLTEGAETIAFFILICLAPQIFPGAAAIFAALCFITTILRWNWGLRILT